jgi:hypothetical protein
MDEDEEFYFTHELPHASQQLRIKANKRRNCLAWILAILIVVFLIVGIAAIVYTLFIWKG